MRNVEEGPRTGCPNLPRASISLPPSATAAIRVGPISAVPKRPAASAHELVAEPAPLERRSSFHPARPGRATRRLQQPHQLIRQLLHAVKGTALALLVFLREQSREVIQFLLRKILFNHRKEDVILAVNVMPVQSN